jgi:hypothetical protein
MGLKVELSLSECVANIKSFDNWIANALVAISPSADIILVSGQSPDNLVLITKLRLEPINQCSVKTLEISLDYDEQITSLLCVPIMSTKKTSSGLVDWTALVVGLSSGYVKFYTEQSICLLTLKFCDEPVISMKLQTQKNNPNARSQAHFATIVDELLITHKSCAIVVDGIGLYENLRISREDIAKNQPGFEPAYTPINLPTILTCQRWKFEDPCDMKVLDADLLGMRCSTKFDIMKSESVNSDNITAKSLTRSLTLVGSNPFVACYREAREITTHSYSEMITSLLPFWSKPQPSKVQINDINCASTSSLFDKGRLVTNIVPSPDKRLLAITDDFGRVMLVDVTNWLVVRIWKGYRNAQCGWVETQRSNEERNSPHALFLVIYAPKRGLLEIWSAQRGPRVAAFNVGKSCRLLYAGYKMINMRAEPIQKSNSLSLLKEQCYSTNCYLLNAENATVYSIELPYTYSLYKFGDMQSRDRLLINELIGLMRQDSEISVISETLNRISLAESREQAIQKVAHFLMPDKIVPVIENLIGKIMKSYDDQSGESMSEDDQSIVELCKRLIRICSIFTEQSKQMTEVTPYPDVDHRFIDECDDHPREVEELAEHLGWTSTEVLRYLSLLALERSYSQRQNLHNPWPDMGEPIAWSEFSDCFDLSRLNFRSRSQKISRMGLPDTVSIKLKSLEHKFLSQEKVLNAALFMYAETSGAFYKVAANSSKTFVEFVEPSGQLGLKHIEPSSRLVLLFQFWLSTKLCNNWKMWTFLQYHIGQISDELKVMAMAQESDEPLIEAWKRIYRLILESDNIYAAIIATAAIRGDTLRTIRDNEKREKLEREDDEKQDDNDGNQKVTSLDWECLCVDAERMSLLIQQLEDVFLLKLLLRYSLDDGHLTDKFVYRIPRISVANILRGGPTVVSELVAQWVVYSNVHPKIFTQPYGLVEDDTDRVIISASISEDRSSKFRLRSESADNEESAKELLHHTKTSFPKSLGANVLMLNCLWEFCNRWAKASSASDKHKYLNKALDCLALLECGSTINLKHNSACLAYKTFFRQTFERLIALIETNSTILSPKCLRSREAISRRELNMGEDCLDDFVQFCHNLSDLMLETSRATSDQMDLDDKDLKLRDQLLSLDDWWSTLSTINKTNEGQNMKGGFMSTMWNISQSGSDVSQAIQTDSLVNAALSSSKLIDIETLVELNRLTTLMVLIFKLRLIKTYPLSLIGEKARQLLKLDLQQSPSTGADIKVRSGQLHELRQKFARKCIMGIVEKLSDETNVLINHDRMFEENTIVERGISSSNDECSVERLKISNKREDTMRQQHESDRDDNATGKSDFDNILTRSSTENNESMVLFTHLLTLANEWELNCDELHLELVFEMLRCNHDKLALQIANRVRDKQLLANGLLKISTQRVLVLFGLSPQLSSELHWSKRLDKWSLFQPNVASWLKSIQEEEQKHELGSLVFPDALRPPKSASTYRKQNANDGDDDDCDSKIELSLGLRLPVLLLLSTRTKSLLETATNYLDGQANRMAYDLLQLLESKSLENFIQDERQRQRSSSSEFSSL